MADPVQPQRDRDLTRHHPHNRHRDRVRRDLFSALHEEVVILALANVDAAAAAADHHTRVRFADAEAGVGPGLTRGNHADECGARVAFRIGAIFRIPDVVAVERRHVVDRHGRDRRGHTAGELRRIEVGNRPRAAAAMAHVFPEPFAAAAKRRHDADATDHDARDGRVTHDAHL